jgi:hypothetical protein
MVNILDSIMIFVGGIIIGAIITFIMSNGGQIAQQFCLDHNSVLDNYNSWSVTCGLGDSVTDSGYQLRIFSKQNTSDSNFSMSNIMIKRWTATYKQRVNGFESP